MSDAKDLLIADLAHFGESLIHNEDVGEKRFSFFVTLVTAVAAGLVALKTKDEPVLPADFMRLTAELAIAALLIVGFLSYLRMVHRNRVTDEYQRTLKYIRGIYTASFQELSSYHYKVPRSHQTFVTKWLKGGYAETVGLIEGMLLTAFMVLVLPEMISLGARVRNTVAISAGLALMLLLWVCAGRRRKNGRSARREWYFRRGRFFRAGVGAVIANQQGCVLALERSDKPQAWQFPQGGLEKDEHLFDAVLREIEEETGIGVDKLKPIAEFPEPLTYQLPAEAQTRKTGMGQVQYWFLFAYLGRDADIKLPKGGEFQKWSWLPFDQVVARVVKFRKPVYQRLMDHFESVCQP